jgi:hypothetical protein
MEGRRSPRPCTAAGWYCPDVAASADPGGGLEGLDLERIVAVVAADVGEPEPVVRPAVERMMEVVADALTGDGSSHVSERAASLLRADSERAARAGELPEKVIDRHLSSLWAIWDGLAESDGDRADLVRLGRRMLKAADGLVAGVAVGYRAVERDLIESQADARRAFLEELLGAVVVDTAGVGRLRRISARNGLDPGGSYRLVAIRATSFAGPTQDEAEACAGRLRAAIGVASTADRSRAGVTLPQVLARRGRVVVLARGSWPGMARLREGLSVAAGASWTAVVSPAVTRVERLAPALARLLDTLRTAERLGHIGWIEHPDDLAVERLLLADDSLLGTVVERELGPLLADARMGEELVETLQVYFDAGENMRETARRMHLANRTVAYRLERIEALLGRPLDGDARQRLVVALLARRILVGTR